MTDHPLSCNAALFYIFWSKPWSVFGKLRHLNTFLFLKYGEMMQAFPFVFAFCLVLLF